VNNPEPSLIGSASTVARQLYEKGKQIYRNGDSATNCMTQHELYGYIDSLADDVKDALTLRSTGR
jgi:hypothetical protein